MNVLKKTILVFLFAALAGSLLPLVAADIGPKPSTTVTVVGVTGDYEFELLIPNRFSVAPAVIHDAEMIAEGWNDHPLYRFLNGYVDADDYISWTLYNYAPTTLYELDPTPEGWRVFKTGYHMRPPTYKVIILTEDELVYVSESVTPAAFYSEVTVDFTDAEGMAATIPAFSFEAPGTVAEAIAFGPLILEFILRLIATVAIELGILFLFGYRKRKSFALAAGVNGVSQTVLTAGVVLVGFLWRDEPEALLVLCAGEFLVIAGETVFYAFRLKERPRPWPMLYGLAANLITFGATFLLLDVFD